MPATTEEQTKIISNHLDLLKSPKALTSKMRKEIASMYEEVILHTGRTNQLAKDRSSSTSRLADTKHSLRVQQTITESQSAEIASNRTTIGSLTETIKRYKRDTAAIESRMVIEKYLVRAAWPRHDAYCTTRIPQIRGSISIYCALEHLGNGGFSYASIYTNALVVDGQCTAGGACAMIKTQLQTAGIHALNFPAEWAAFAANDVLHYPGNNLQKRDSEKVFHLKMTSLGRAFKQVALLSQDGTTIIEYSET
jgi:hypothetical protein